MARRLRKAQLFLATLVVSGAALLAASSAPHRASATFVAPTTPPTSSSSPSPQQLLSASSNLLDSVANATTHKLELLVASLGKLSPPWLTQIANEAGKRQHEAKAALGLPTTRATAAAATTSPAALPYAAPPTDAWLAADPCHAVPSPCAATKPFELSEVRPARASAGEGGGRLSAPAHLAPLTPTAPWSQVSGPGGSGPNPYWVTGQAATSVLGLSPGFEADPAASMVLEVAGEAALGRDTGRDAESAAVAAAPGRGLAAAEAGGASAGNISASALARASPSARRLLMAMKQQQQKMQQQKMQQRQQQGRKKLLASLPPPPSAASAPPPRASWSGALSASSPKDSSDNNNDNSGARFSATPLVVDTEGAGYRFQVSSAASWAPALALYRGGAIPPKGGERPQLVAASSSPLAGKPNSAVLSVRESLRRGEVYTLVVTAAADSAAAAGGDRDAAVGSFAALASGPGGVYPGATSVPPRWRVSSSTTAQAQGGAKEEEDSSPPPPTSSRGVLRRPEAEVDGARAGARAGARGGGDRDAPAVVAFEALPFVLASAGRGFELRVQAGASASSSPSTKGRSWSPWAAVYDADAFQQALDEAAARASPPGAPPALSTSGLVAAAVAAEGSGSVTLRGLSLEGAGKRYTLVVGGRTPADGGEFVAEAFGPEAIKGFVAPTPMPTPTPAAAPPPPSSSPPPPSPSSLPHLIEEASAPAPSSPPSSSGGRPRLLDPVSIDPPPPPPVRFAEYGIQHHGGPMMTGVPTLNFVYYSTPKFQPTTRAILDDLGRGLGESAWYRVQSSYPTKAGGSMTPALRFGGPSPLVDEGDACWSGRALTDTAVGAVVTCLIKAGRVPYAANSLTLVLTGPDVSQGASATGSFCSNFCGWHSYTYDARGRPFKFGFVGSAARCPSACAGQSAASPNGNVEADAMASIIAHEVTEAATDPELSAWFDGEGKENADKCAWTYGSVWKVIGGGGAGSTGKSNGGKPPSATAAAIPGAGGVANAKVGGREFLLQLNWANKATQGYCDNK